MKCGGRVFRFKRGELINGKNMLNKGRVGRVWRCGHSGEGEREM